MSLLGKRKKAETETLIAGLPEDVQLFHILPLLPTKALCRFKCVCKRWQSAISDIVPRRSSSLAYISAADHHLISLTEIGHSKTGISFSLPRKELYLVAACNGLLCWDDFSDSKLFFVFNPRTREWSHIPKLTEMRLTVGLAFDPSVSEHYKLVRECGWAHPPYLCFEVFSSDTGKWRVSRAKIPNMDLFLDEMNTAFVDGILFWKAGSWFIWFDVEKENAGIGTLPGNNRRLNRRVRFGEWDGMLTLHKITDSDIEIWIMNNKTGGFQWVKMFFVSQYGVFRSNLDRFNLRCAYPLPYVGGQLLMFKYKKYQSTRFHCNFVVLLSFNINKVEWIECPFTDDSEYFVYKESHFPYPASVDAR